MATKQANKGTASRSTSDKEKDGRSAQTTQRKESGQGSKDKMGKH